MPETTQRDVQNDTPTSASSAGRFGELLYFVIIAAAIIFLIVRRPGKEPPQKTGRPNLRLKDNLYQALAVIIAIPIGGSIFAKLLDRYVVGMFIGGVVGALIALIATGIHLMIVRRENRE